MKALEKADQFQIDGLEAIVATLKKGPLRVLAKVTEDQCDRVERLRVSHPHFEEATQHLSEELFFCRYSGRGLTHLRLLLVAPPGTGKTDYALEVASLVGLPHHMLGFSSGNGFFTLGGVEVGWASAQPGMIARELIHGETANFMMILDEVDKAAQHRNQDALGALYPLLESRTARRFCDNALPWLELDASHVNYIATANDIDCVHPAILSRFHIVHVHPPSKEQMAQISKAMFAQLCDDLTQRRDDRGQEKPTPLILSESALLQLGALERLREIKATLRTSIIQALKAGDGDVKIKTIKPPSLTKFGFI
jgi:ATP-dependent Lon protease